MEEIDSQLPRAGSVIGGRYRVESVLGRGGMGVVLAGVQVATGRPVAIKWMRQEHSHEAVTRFVAEARTTARIEHPNVVEVFDVGAAGGSPFLVMERLRGESLGARLRRGPMSPLEALEVAIAACRGIAEAHAEGVVHRDLKPDNIFLCQGKDGSPRPPKVLDFGISKLLEVPGGESLTQTGVSLGTPSYMAPEQISSPRDVDARVDVYAIGVVLYRALTGRLPFEAETVWLLVHQVMQGRPAPIRTLAPEVPPALEAVVLRAMSAKREARHASMRELLAELEWIHAALSSGRALPMPVGPPPGAMTSAPPARLSFALRAAAALGLAGLAVTIVAAVALWPGDRAQGPLTAPSAPAPSAPAPSADPLRPRVQLTFGEACQPLFEGTLMVRRHDSGALMVMAIQNDDRVGAILIHAGSEPPRGTIMLTEEQLRTQQSHLMVTDSRARSWGSWRTSFDEGAWPITGSLTFRQWEPERGLMDVSIDDVTLRANDDGSSCRVTGRIQTFGLVWDS